MRDYKNEYNDRIEFIREILTSSRAKSLIFANSGGKDSALAGILCKAACGDTVGVIMPCGTKANYGQDRDDALALAEQFGIETRTIDLTAVRDELVKNIGEAAEITENALSNIAPRLRMTSLYAISASENRLVCGTGNRSERYMGYFTKWGDGAFDFNPIGDLTVTEIYEFLRFLNAPASIIGKAPSAGLFEGQTDEGDMGVTYAGIDRFLTTGSANEADLRVIERYHNTGGHKLRMPPVYSGGWRLEPGN